MKLLIAVPAFNEEDSIVQIIERCIEAKEHIVEGGVVDDIRITVVSDGSTDRTVELASRYLDKIDLIIFERNKGYGAAIKKAWDNSDAEIVGFLDADGTCEPKFFKSLIDELVKAEVDIVLGCRLNADSKMPMVRKLGNSIFAKLLSAISSNKVRDTASGMRVLRRSSLNKIYPLPDGLHFTPAMSAKAMLSGNLTISEIDMPYHERDGESKLHVIKDGIRFLAVILQTAFAFRPSRPLGTIGIVFLLLGTLPMLQPALHYLQYRNVEEWMIYRFVVFNLMATAGAMVLAAAYLSSRLVSIVLLRQNARGITDVVYRVFMASNVVIYVAIVLAAMGVAMVVPSIIQLATTGSTYEHWSRFIIMSQFVTTATVLIVTKAVDLILELLMGRLSFLDEQV
ncbi:MAG: glycosyltransferase family 2 protein [Bacteroidota bacterium]